MSTEIAAPYTYNLTELVGRRADDGRTMIVATFEVQKRHLLIALGAALPALIVSLVLATILGVWAILVFLAIEAAAFYLVEGRTNDGLQLRRYEHLNDKRVANTGKVFICGREVDPSLVEIVNVQGRLLAPMPIAPRQRLEHEAATEPAKPRLPVTLSGTPASTPNEQSRALTGRNRLELSEATA